LDRADAIKILKEMTSECSDDWVTSIVIVPPNKANNTLSVGYQIHIKGSSYHQFKDLEAKIKLHKLAVKEEKETIIIYKPKC
jgi:hypothetical protein